MTAEATDIDEVVGVPPAPQQWKFLLGLFLVMAALYGLCTGGHTYSIDEELMVSQSEALLDLRPDVEYVEPDMLQLYRDRGDGTYSTVYGLGQSVVALPFMALGKVLALGGSDPAASVSVYTATLLTNSFVTALTVVVVILLAQQLGASWRGSVLLGLLYGLSTFAFPHAKTFGSEPGAALLIALAVLMCLRAEAGRPGRWLVLAGLCAAGAAHFRVSTVVFLPVFGLFLLLGGAGFAFVERIRRAAFFTAGALASLAVLALTNAWRYRDPFDIGYETVDTSYPIYRGLVNLYFSVGKGFFEFAPILIVVAVGLIAFWRRVDLRYALILCIIAVNSLVVARLAVWSGDAAWGPRYMLVVLPIAVAMGALVIDRVPWRRASLVAGIVGMALPALMGVLVYFNVFMIDAIIELGADPVHSDGAQPEFLVKVRHDPEWNQILGHIELLPEAIEDTFSNGLRGTEDRAPYSTSPPSHYGYFGDYPRIDFWWLWVGPTRGRATTYLLAPALVGLAAVGARLLVVARHRERTADGSDEQLAPDDVAAPTLAAEI